MSRMTGFALALGAACALGACAGEGGQLPTSEAPAFQTGGVGPACNLTDLRKATSALFGNKHPANTIAKQFTSKNQNTALVEPFAYNLFAEIEAKREGDGTWVSGDPEKGAELTLQIIACSPLDYTDDALEGTANLAAARGAFEDALDLAGTGTYAVRGGVSGEIGVTSKNLQAGLQAPDDFATWFGGRSLIIGYSITPFDFSTEDEAGVWYDWSMVRPAGSTPLEGLATISYCVSNDFAGFENELRVQHLPSGQGGTILPIPPVGNGVPGVFCDPDLSLQRAAPTSFASRLLEGLFDMIRPAPLFAGAVLKGPVSGTLGDFSPTGVVDPNATIISFAVLPTGGTTNTNLPLQVLVTGAQGTPWAGITVRITASENNGATLAPCGTEAVTNGDGLAIFEHFQINKPGTVHLTATTIETPEGIAQDYDEVSILSDDFVITGAGNERCTEPE